MDVLEHTTLLVYADDIVIFRESKIELEGTVTKHIVLSMVKRWALK